MAEGGRQRRRSDDQPKGPGLGAMLAAGAFAAGVGALMYGAKKLYDYVSEEQAMESKESGCYRPPPEPSFSARPASEDQHPGIQTVPRVLQKAPASKKISLALQLEEYHNRYVVIPEEQMQRALQVVEDMKYYLLQFLQKEHSRLLVKKLTNIGSAFEDLLVVSPEEVDLLVPISLEAPMWTVVEAGELGSEATGHYAVQRINLEEHPLGSHQYDEFIDGTYLSREAVSEALRAGIEDAANHIHRYTMASGTSSPLRLDVNYRESGVPKNLSINLFPAVHIQGRLLMSRSQLVLRETSEHDTLFQESFAVQEAQKLRAMNPEWYCHLKCLKIIKAIRLNHPAQFGAFSSYVYKTVLLHMMEDTPEEDLWRPECLQEQFVDMLNQLLFYVQGRKLPDVFNEKVNLLEDATPEECDRLVNFITTRIGKEKLHTLLEQRVGY